MILNSPTISGSLTVTGNIITSGSITISGSIASASYATNAELLDGLDSTAFATTGAYSATSASLYATSASLSATSGSLSATSGSLSATSGSLSATSGSLSTASGSFNTRVTALEVTGSALSSSLLTVSGSGYATSGSLSTASGSFDSRVATIESKYATTGSNTFTSTQVVSGSILQSGSFTTTGTIIAQTINVQTVTSSVVYSSGSNVFGNSIGNSQTFTGSVLITGSLTIAGNITSNGNAAVLGSGSTCYLPKFTGASTIGNSLVYDNGTNVGINTATPNDYIDGESGMAILRATNGRAVLSLVGTRTDAGETLGRISFTNTNSTNAGSKRLAYISGTRGTTNNSAYLEFAVANDTLGAVAMTLSQTGNLGLGVTPSAFTSTTTTKSFEIGSLGNAIYGVGAADLRIMSNTYFDGSYRYAFSGALSSLYTISDGNFKWFNAPSGTAGCAITFTQAMTLFSTGNLAIATTTDSGYKLDVNGTGRFTSNLLAQKVQVGTAASINDATGVGNTLQFANYSAGVFVTASADSYIYKTSSVFGGLSAQTLIFQTRSDVAGGGFAFVAGTTPSAIATISNTGAATFSSSVTAAELGSTSGIYAQRNGSNTQGSGPYFLLANAATNQLWYQQLNASNGLDFWYNGSVKLNIASTGAATFSSSVTAGGKIFTSASVADNIIEVINSDTTNGYGLYVRGGGTASGRYVARFKNGADSDVMWVGNNGNVGIGTCSPGQTLHVYNGNGATGYKAARFDSNDTSNGTRVLISNSGNTAANNYGFISGGTLLGVDKFSIARLNTDSTYSDLDIMVFDTNGNVGIGTCTPAYSLSVKSGWIHNYGAQNASGFRYENDASGHVLNLNANNAYAQLYTSTDTSLYFGTSNEIRFKILNTGTACFSSTVCAPCFATISDYRMKSNIRPIAGLSIIMNTKPYKFEYNYDCSTSFGMIAHELQDTLPEAVFGYKDGEVMQGVDYMKLLPIAIKAIQELKAENDIFKTCLGIS